MRIGVVNLMGLTFVPFFPNVALAGATLGLVLWTVGRLWTIHPQDQSVTSQ
jgi:hypothetical protein